MSGRQAAGGSVSASLAGMSKNQLYDIVCQMKTLIEQNQQQARQILIQNPALTKALFQEIFDDFAPYGAKPFHSAWDLVMSRSSPVDGSQ